MSLTLVASLGWPCCSPSWPSSVKCACGEPCNDYFKLSSYGGGGMFRMNWVLPLLIAVTLIGCEEDKELAELALEANRQQSEQNQEMAKLNREVAEGSKRLIEADAEATTKRLTMEQQLQEQRSDVEAERQQLAQERKAESILGPALVTAASLTAVCLPLVLCWYLLHGMQRDSEPAVSEMLIEELELSAGDAPAVPKSAKVSEHHLEA